jgi:hypothetical protein
MRARIGLDRMRMRLSVADDCSVLPHPTLPQPTITHLTTTLALESSALKARFVHKLELSIHMPGDRITTQGDFGDEMYFIIRGKCIAYDEDATSAM